MQRPSLYSKAIKPSILTSTGSFKVDAPKKVFGFTQTLPNFKQFATKFYESSKKMPKSLSLTSLKHIRGEAGSRTNSPLRDSVSNDWRNTNSRLSPSMRSMRSEVSTFGKSRRNLSEDVQSKLKTFKKLDEPLFADKMSIDRMLLTKTGLVVTENNFLPLLR